MTEIGRIDISPWISAIMTMTPDGYRRRYADEWISHNLAICGAIHIKGPKGCGKTWTALNHANSALMLDNPSEDYANRRYAREEPMEAVKGNEPRLIDEWQEAPGIWDATRCLVDSGHAKGRVILCGSSTPDADTLQQLHSGFARICTRKMRTMSLYESGDSDGAVSLSEMFGHEPAKGDWKSIDVNRITELVVRGGWPETVGMDVRDAFDFNRNLLETLCESDIPRIDRSVSPSTAKRLLKSFARNESTVATDKTIRMDMRENDDERPIAKETLTKYEMCLDRLHLIENQPAFNPGLKSPVRVGKNPKRHLTDPGLAVAALGANKARLSEDRKTLDFLFEAMCERDLQIYAKALDGDLYHYRDGDGREIDAIVELPDGRWGAFEIKLTRQGTDEGAENLLKIRNYIERREGSKPPSLLCVICGTAEAPKLRDDGVYVVPVTRLKA